MLHLCPFCGHFLSKPLADGISSCTNCSRIFDSNPMNRMLSAGWLVRRRHIDNAEDLVREGFTVEEANVVIAFVVEHQCSPQEFYQALKRIGISDIYTLAS